MVLLTTLTSIKMVGDLEELFVPGVQPSRLLEVLLAGPGSKNKIKLIIHMANLEQFCWATFF